MYKNEPKHQRGTPEWLEFNATKINIASGVLTRLMDEAGLFPVAQERLRKAFQFATNVGGMKEAVAVEMRLQAADTDRFHQEHAAEYLAACGVRLEDLKTDGGVQ